LSQACGSLIDPEDRIILGEISGYDEGDPLVEISTAGLSASVTVVSFGGGCHSAYDTLVSVNGSTAHVFPYDAYPEGAQHCARLLRYLGHRVLVEFDTPGEKTVVVHGLSKEGAPLSVCVSLILPSSETICPSACPHEWVRFP
jgi:hypothetical protein